METKSIRLHSHLLSLPVYQPGRPLEEVARELGLPFEQIIKLASNENPLGPSPKAVEAMKEALDCCHLYPDGNAYYLKEKLASKLGVLPANIILSNGSNELIEWVGHTVLDSESNIVVSQYCFAIYPLVARMFGASVKTVAARNHSHDLKGMLNQIDGATKAVFIANPNNPTGTMVTHEELNQFLEAVPSEVLVVMDEAYIEYLEHPIDLISDIQSDRYSNLLVMRTFSKIYGLAGLRLGYGVAPRHIIGAMEKVRQPFNANALAQAGALAALDDQEYIRQSRELNRQGVTQLQDGFTELGLEFVPSFANFVLVRVGEGMKTFARMQEQGVIVRPMDAYQLPEWIRISAGTREQNAKCLTVLRQVL